MSREPASSEQNNILGALSNVYYKKLSGQMEPVTLRAGMVLYDVGEPIKHVYFPRTAVVSLVGLTADGRGTEVAMIGSEGFLGVPILLGAISQPYEATIQIAGRLWKMRKEVLDGPEDGALSLTRILRRYATIRVNQISQSAICNRFHSLKQRLCRWLLTAADRRKSERLSTLGGTFALDSTVGKGTRITLTVPLRPLSESQLFRAASALQQDPVSATPTGPPNQQSLPL